MELQRPTAPEAARNALRDALLPLAHRGTTEDAPDLYLGVDREDQIELPFYVLATVDVTREPWSQRTGESGWAFIVRTRLTDHFSSKISLAFFSSQGSGYRFTHVVHGWLPRLLVLGANRAPIINQELQGVYLPTLLTIFGNRSCSLWLQDVNENTTVRDYVIGLSAHRLAELSEGDVNFRAEPYERFIRKVVDRQMAATASNAPQTTRATPSGIVDVPLPPERER